MDLSWKDRVLDETMVYNCGTEIAAGEHGYPLEQSHRHQDYHVLCSLNDYIMGILDISLTLPFFLYSLTKTIFFTSLTHRNSYDFFLFFFLLRFSLRVLEHLKVTTLRASSIRLFPV